MTWGIRLEIFRHRASRLLLACTAALGLAVQASLAVAHPLEFHLDPLDDEAIERVLTSFELLAARLEAAGLQGSARLPENAMGITAIVWSTEDAIAAMDHTRPADSPTLRNALTAAGYEDSPYVVAEWKMEAERVLESYEVLSGDLQFESIYRTLSELESSRGRLTDDEAEQKEAELIRQVSMLRTTAGDIAQVAPYRDRLDTLTGELNP